MQVGVKDSIEGLDDVNKVTIKFFTVGGAMPAGKAVAGQADKMPAVLASLSPLAIAITIAVAVLLALAIAFGGQIGRTSVRERVCAYGVISVVAVPLKTNHKTHIESHY